MRIRKRKPTSVRNARRRRFLLQLLASVSIGVGGIASAQETRLAYYAAHPSEMKGKVRVVDGDDVLAGGSILQVQATQELLEHADDAVESSSDIPGDDFLSDLPAPFQDSVSDDVDAVVDQAMQPMAEAEFNDRAVAAPPAPPAPFRRSRGGAVAASYSSAPNMIGDFFGGTFFLGSLLGHTVALAGGDRRFKVAENTSPVPQDRVFFNYNHFHNALRDINEVSRNLDRFTFGVEKTFGDGVGSIELRLPFAGALDSTQAFGASDTRSTEFGNIATSLKFNLLSGRDWMLSGGTTMTLPTGDDFVLLSGPQPILVVQNEAVHLAPFIGMLKSGRTCFAQAFIQADFDLNGNDVFTDIGYEGVLQDQNLLFIDASVGRWLSRDCSLCSKLTGVAAIAELHYTTTMNDTDDVAMVSNRFNRMDLLNATGALNFQFCRTSMRVGAAAPLRGDEENLFDAEVIFQLNHRY